MQVFSIFSSRKELKPVFNNDLKLPKNFIGNDDSTVVQRDNQ